MSVSMRPERPGASCRVATPNRESAATTPASGRWIWRTAIELMEPFLSGGPDSQAARLQRPVEPWIDAARVAFEDLAAICRSEVRGGLDVAPRVVIVEPCLRIDALHRAEHLGREQDVVRGNHARQQVDARLVVDAGVEPDVVQEVVLEERPLQFLRQAAKTPPMVGHRAAAVRDDEAQRGKILEQVRSEALHEGGRVGVEVMSAGGVKAGV